MRIRLRVPTDGAKKPAGIGGWLQGLFTKPSAPLPSTSPAPKIDKRWTTFANARYFHAGRLCTIRQGDWHAEYLFDVDASGNSQQIRVIIPEPAVAIWEKAHAKRMPEALRLRLVRETLEALLTLDRFPSAMLVNPVEIENAKL